jgi:ATPase, YjeE family
MVEKHRTTDSPDETRRMAELIGKRCAGGEIILLYGDLGSGKTCFTQGLAVGLGVPAETRVTSPTFTLHGEYPGRLVLNHLDLYRLEDPAALEGLGLDEMFADKGAVTVVEWPEIMGPFSGDRLDVRITDRGDGKRLFAMQAWGEKSAPLIQGIP